MLGHPLRINSHGRLDASVGRVSRVLIYVGAMAEQLGRGLQNLVDRCNSGSRLVCAHFLGEWWNGIHDRLKICWASAHEGSTPSSPRSSLSERKFFRGV